MRKGNKMIGYIILAVILGVVIYAVLIYNKLVSLKNRAENAWSDIEVQLKKRFNLIPNLVELVKSYKDYESSTLEKVIQARKQFQNSSSIEEKIDASKTMLRGINTFFAVAEAYPDLKANTQYTNLKNELVNLENDIENARRYYNAVIRDYNTAIEIFPNVIIANQFHFTKLPFFELQESEKEEVYKTPRIKL